MDCLSSAYLLTICWLLFINACEYYLFFRVRKDTPLSVFLVHVSIIAGDNILSRSLTSSQEFFQIRANSINQISICNFGATVTILWNRKLRVYHRKHSASLRDTRTCSVTITGVAYPNHHQSDYRSVSLVNHQPNHQIPKKFYHDYQLILGSMYSSKSYTDHYNNH